MLHVKKNKVIGPFLDSFFTKYYEPNSTQLEITTISKLVHKLLIFPLFLKHSKPTVRLIFNSLAEKWPPASLNLVL